jgi:hypothetical protein
MNLGAFEGARVLDEPAVQEIRRNQIPDLVGWHQGLIWYGQRRRGASARWDTPEETTARARGCSSDRTVE